MLPLGTTTDTIPERLRLYQKCRLERATTIQEFSRLSGRDLGVGPPIDHQKLSDYNFGHDEWHFSTQALREWEWEKKKESGSLLWRMPTAFGPMPGPRQDFLGRPRNGANATFTTTSVRFKTSRTILENLLPGKNLTFAAADTVAYATFAATQLGNLEWLGGRGYTHFGLYIHGISYTKADGETVIGSYLPVLFENLADPILSGREELGFPKLFADLAVHKADDGKWRLDASWMGEKFCALELEGLQDENTATTNGHANGVTNGTTTTPRDDGLLLQKYIPATASPGSKVRGQPDVEYTTFVSNADDAKTVTRSVQSTAKASKATISFDPRDWKALPTLHHVVERLAEIPVYDVVEAKIVTGTGVSDVSCVQRLV